MADRKKSPKKGKNEKPAKPAAKKARPKKGQPAAMTGSSEQSMHH